MGDAAPPHVDPGSLIRSKDYRVLLVFAALIGVVVSVASWAFLEAIHYIQQWVYQDLPSDLGFDSVPSWWPLPVLGVAGVIVAFAIARLPGRGGHEPAEGLKAGPPTKPIELPGVVLAALAAVGLGMVLGPEAPLIGMGTGLAILSVRLAKKDAPDQVLGLMAAAASFAAISTLFGSPVISAVIIIEAAGLGGPMLPVVLLPGLLAAGIGSLVFIGLGSLSGLSTSAYALAPLSLPAYPEPSLSAFGWTIVLAPIVALVCFFIMQIGRMTEGFVVRRPFVFIPVAALLVAALAIAFAQITGQTADLVLFSGQEAMGPLVDQAATLSSSTLGFLILFKGLAYGLSLGSGRGGPTFPAMFLGIVGGLLAANLPGFSETPAVAALMGAATVAILRLPLASVVVAMLVSQAGLATTPLIIVAAVVAHITVELLAARRTSPTAAAPVGAPKAREDVGPPA
jgi:H+/Cl- antiporter ClcA